jgi:hypothetical protein
MAKSFVKRAKKSVKDKKSPKTTKLTKYYDIKTFSYFIPAPPDRTSSYREREFDKTLYALLEVGHEIINFYSTTHGSQGTLMVCLLGSTHPKACGWELELDHLGLDNQNRDFKIEMLES